MTAAGTSPLVERGHADAFFADWLARSGTHHPATDASSWLHEQILDAAFEDQPAGSMRRRLAISTPGVPVVYSHKCTRERKAPRFRMLAEPGGTARTVAEQVVLSRALLHRAAGHLGWQRVAGRVDAVLDRLLPADPDALAGWHGGLGFGLETGADGPELRLYCNVRQGDLADRWQRFADTIGEFADERAEPAFREILRLAAPRTLPAGIALSLGRNELQGIRLYCELSDPISDSVIAATPTNLLESAGVIRRFVDSYHALGNGGGREITLGYDFAAHNELLHPAVARYKVDAWCEEACRRDRAYLLTWVEDQVTSLRMDHSGLQDFFANLDHRFGGWTLQYLSLGCRNGTEELTAYCIPGWQEPSP